MKRAGEILSFNPLLTRVLVYVPSPLLAEAVCRGLASCAPFTTKACSDDLIGALRAFRPNVIIVDPRHLSTALRTWRAEVLTHLPRCEVLAYVEVGNNAAAQQCLAAGFAGAVSQARGIAALVEAVTAAMLGGIYVDHGFTLGTATAAGVERAPSPLSPRERYVLEQVARGLSNKEVARSLGVSPKTVETHRARATMKLGLRHRSDIVEYALRNDWLADQLSAP